MRVNRQDLLNIKSLIECGTITERKFKNQEIVSQLKLNGSVLERRKKTIKYIDLAKKELNDWEPNIQLEEGLIKTIAYFKNQLKK